ncbi:MAG: zinc-ribbon domain-containing protein [Oscillospiraceae bacterium]|nr:zinc-ribbon domain-containing protein [Oscillospiraceae bacterium]
MFCPECGHALADDEYFCPECGAKRPEEEAVTPEPAPTAAPVVEEVIPDAEPLIETFTVEDIMKEEAAPEVPPQAAYEAPQAEPVMAHAAAPEAPKAPKAPKEKKEHAPLPLKKILLAVAAVIVVVALVFVGKAIFAGGGSSSAIGYKDAVTRVYTDDDDKFIFVTAAGKTYEIESDEPASFRSSMDRSVHTWISEASSRFGTLNCFKNGKQAEISDCVYSSSVVISQKGDYIWYLYSDKEDIDKLELCRYEVSSGKTVSVASKVNTSAIVLSPDGKSAAFTDTKDKTYVSVNGKEPSELGKDITVLTVSDSAKLIFAAKYSSKSGDYSLVRYKGVKDEGEKVSGIDSLDASTNLSRTQLTYRNSGSLYYAEAKGEKVKVGKDARNVTVALGSYYDSWTSGASGNVSVLNRENLLADLIVYSDGSDYIYASYKKGETSKIEKSDNPISLQAGGSTAVYVDKDEIMMSRNGKAFEKWFEADDDIYYRYMTPDYKNVYFVTEEDDEVLYYTNGKKTTEVTDEFGGSLRMTEKGVFLFTNEDDELCFSKNGSKAEIVSGIDGEIKNYQYLGGIIFIVSEADDDDYVLYSISTDGKAKEVTRGEYLSF